uniref:Uncharacterized protein n=1 Tax=Lotharella oceanica TaxID=641309 RepID=A0A7S2TKR9_9EUKA|mmetsp:Transcript_18709/g.35318  ORF Transcript_18709/g.35318 Transcript_18709/m.35318 type:complete len:592 (+) Transcript_18709:18-1793(+)
MARALLHASLLLVFSSSAGFQEQNKENIAFTGLPGGEMLMSMRFTLGPEMSPGGLHEHLERLGVTWFYATVTNGFWQPEWQGSYPGPKASASPPGTQLWASVQDGNASDNADSRLRESELFHIISQLTRTPLVSEYPGLSPIVSHPHQPPGGWERWGFSGFPGFEKTDTCPSSRPDGHFIHVRAPRERACRSVLSSATKMLPCRSRAGIGKLLESPTEILRDALYLSVGYLYASIDEDATLVQSFAVGVMIDVVLPFASRAEEGTTKRLIEVADYGGSRRPRRRKGFPSSSSSSSSSSPSSLSFSSSSWDCPLSQFGSVRVNLAEKDGWRWGKGMEHGEDQDGHNRQDFFIGDVSLLGDEVSWAPKFDSENRGPDGSLRVLRHVTQRGRTVGTLHSQIYNRHRVPLKVSLLDVIPWEVMVVAHSIRITLACKHQKPVVLDPFESWNSSETFEFISSPGNCRGCPTMVELTMDLDQECVVSMDVSFFHRMLPGEELPPDVDYGLLVPGFMVYGCRLSPKGERAGTSTTLSPSSSSSPSSPLSSPSSSSGSSSSSSSPLLPGRCFTVFSRDVIVKRSICEKHDVSMRVKRTGH